MAQWWHIDTHRSAPVRETRYLRRYRKQGFRSAPPPVSKHWHKTQSGKYRLLAEIDFNRKWLGGGKPHYSRAVRYGKFAAKMIPHVRLGLTIWELYTIGKYVHSQYQLSNQSITEFTPKPPYDLSPWIEAPKFQYQELVGYQDDGPVPWYRTV